MIDVNKNAGFIALISVIIISLVLLGTTVSLSTTGFLNRFNILEGEAKEISAGYASSCVESARLKIANDSTYTPPAGGEGFDVDGDPIDDECTIVSVLHVGNSIIHAQGIYKRATTNYEVEVDANLDIISWKEI